MRLLQDSFWYVDVLQCLLKWRRLDSSRMDAEMEKRAEYLVDVFSFCGKPGFQKALEPLLDIVQVHVRLPHNQSHVCDFFLHDTGIRGGKRRDERGWSHS